MPRPVKDVLHVRSGVHQVRGLVSVPVLGRQTCQVGEVVDVSIGERGEAKAVDVADGHGGKNHLRGGFLVQSRHMRVLQVGDGTFGRVVQKQGEGSQKGESPESLPDAEATRDEDVVNPMEGAGVCKPRQVLGRRCAALLDQALLVSILFAFLLLILLCKFDFANKFDRHGGSQVCVWGFLSDGSFQPRTPSLLLAWLRSSEREKQLWEEEEREERVCCCTAAACAETDAAPAAAAASAPAAAAPAPAGISPSFLAAAHLSENDNRGALQRRGCCVWRCAKIRRDFFIFHEEERLGLFPLH